VLKKVVYGLEKYCYHILFTMSRKLHVHLYTLTHQPLFLGAPNAEAIPEAEAGADADADADPQSQVCRSIKSWQRLHDWGR
jgi:hypothetical protein